MSRLALLEGSCRWFYHLHCPSRISTAYSDISPMSLVSPTSLTTAFIDRLSWPRFAVVSCRIDIHHNAFRRRSSSSCQVCQFHNRHWSQRSRRPTPSLSCRRRLHRHPQPQCFSTATTIESSISLVSPSSLSTLFLDGVFCLRGYGVSCRTAIDQQRYSTAYPISTLCQPPISLKKSWK